MTNLNTLIPAGSPMFLLEALGKNDLRQIGRYGRLSHGDVQACVRTRCEEDHGPVRPAGKAGAPTWCSKRARTGAKCSPRRCLHHSLVGRTGITPPATRKKRRRNVKWRTMLSFNANSSSSHSNDTTLQ